MSELHPSHVVGLPQPLCADEGRLFYDLIDIGANQRRAYTRFIISELSHDESWLMGEGQQSDYIREFYSASSHRRDCLLSVLNPRVQRRRRRFTKLNKSIDLNIASRYYGYPNAFDQIDYDATVATLSDEQAAAELRQLIAATPKALKPFWLIWQKLFPELHAWSERGKPRREAVVLGLFVLTSISDSLQPVRWAEAIVPELAAVFEPVSLQETYIGPVSAVAEPEPATLQQKWTSTVRKAGVLLNEIEFAKFRDVEPALKQFDDLIALLEDYGKQGDQERLSQRGLTTAQFIARVRELIEQRGASWLQPAIKVASDAWKSVAPDSGKSVDQTRAAGLDWIAAHLLMHAELSKGDTEARAALEAEILNYFTRGRPLTPPESSSLLSSSTPLPEPDPPQEPASEEFEPEPQPDPIFVAPVPAAPPPAASTATFDDVVAAYFALEQTEYERPVRSADMLWALIDRNQILLAYHFAAVLEGEGANILPCALMKAVALSPLVINDVCPATIAYNTTLNELDIAALEDFGEYQRGGYAALGVSASLHATLFSPSSGAAKLLSASNRHWKVEFSRVLDAAVHLSEQGLALTLSDFKSTLGAETSREAQYRRERIKPLIDSLLAELRPAVAYCDRAASAADTLEERAGYRLASATLQSLFLAVTVGAQPWSEPMLNEWLQLPVRAIGLQSAPVATAVVNFVHAGSDYHALAEQALASGSLCRVRAMLHELQRIGSKVACIAKMQALVDEHKNLVHRFGQHVEGVQRQLRDGEKKQWLMADEVKTYETWLEGLKRSAREADGDLNALDAELSGVVELLNEHRKTAQDRLRKEVNELRKSADAANASDEVRRWFTDIDGALNRAEFNTAQRYLAQLKERLKQAESGDRYRYRWLQVKNGDKALAFPSPLSIADDLRILGLNRDPAAFYTISLIFGVPASGLLEIPRAFESIHRQPDRPHMPAHRIETAGPHQVATLRELRKAADAVEFNSGAPCIMHIAVPGRADDPRFAEEILELAHKLKPTSAQRRLRIVLEFGSEAAWYWILNRGDQLEHDLVKLRLAPLSSGALEALLTELKLPNGPTDIECLQRYTGGWYRNVRPFIQAARKAGKVKSVQELFLDQDGPAQVGAQGARDALRAYGLDVPHTLGIFQELVTQQVHTQFDRETLDIVIAGHSEHAELPLDAFVTWTQGIGLIASNADGDFGINPMVVALLERSLA